MLRVVLLAFLSILPAKPDRYVTDQAKVFEKEREDTLNSKLADFERETSNQLIVYIDSDIPEGTTLEEMSVQALTEWGVGQKGKDNGAILFLFTKPKKYRIEVGYGLEGVLTDAKSKRITNEVMKPLLRSGDTAGAIEAGVAEMIKVIREEGNVGTGQTVAETQTAAPAEDKPSAGELISGFLILIVGGLLCIGAPVLLLIALARSMSRRREAEPTYYREVPRRYEPEPEPEPEPPRKKSVWFPSPAPSPPKREPEPEPDPPPSRPSKSDDFKGGGGRGGGGGASDSW